MLTITSASASATGSTVTLIASGSAVSGRFSAA
jgi:hypothetical protein